ncbi:MAG: hypothetical protein IJZ72_04825 [Oscillospiraceae bacterium]|nr:hypothetical protein [Oscillospiraceae bacterium]
MGNFNFIETAALRNNVSLTKDERKEIAESFNRAERLIKADFRHSAIVLRKSWEMLARCLWNPDKIDFGAIRSKLKMNKVREYKGAVGGSEGKLRLLSRSAELSELVLDNDDIDRDAISQANDDEPENYGLSYFKDKDGRLCNYDVLEYVRIVANYGAHYMLQNADDNLTKFIANISYGKMLQAFKYTHLLLKDYVFDCSNISYNEDEIQPGRYEAEKIWDGYLSANQQELDALKARKYYLGKSRLILREKQPGLDNEISEERKVIIKEFFIPKPDAETQDYTFKKMIDMKTDRIQYFSGIADNAISIAPFSMVSDGLDAVHPFAHIVYNIPKKYTDVVPLRDKITLTGKAAASWEKDKVYYCRRLVQFFIDFEEKYSKMILRGVSPAETWVGTYDSHFLDVIFTNFEECKADIGNRQDGVRTMGTAGSPGEDTNIYQLARLLFFIWSKDHYYYSGEDKGKLYKALNFEEQAENTENSEEQVKKIKMFKILRTLLVGNAPAAENTQNNGANAAPAAENTSDNNPIQNVYETLLNLFDDEVSTKNNTDTQDKSDKHDDIKNNTAEQNDTEDTDTAENNTAEQTDAENTDENISVRSEEIGGVKGSIISVLEKIIDKLKK